MLANNLFQLCALNITLFQGFPGISESWVFNLESWSDADTPQSSRVEKF